MDLKVPRSLCARNFSRGGGCDVPQFYRGTSPSPPPFSSSIWKNRFWVYELKWNNPTEILLYDKYKYLVLYRVTHKRWDCNDDPKLWKYDDLKLEFWFLQSKEFRWLLNWKAQKYACFGLQGTLNARKRTKQIPYNRLWSLFLCK